MDSGGKVSNTGCGAAEARLFWEQEVVGSIPTTPTILEVIDFTATRDGEAKSLQVRLFVWPD